MVTVRYDDNDEMSVTRALNKQTPIDPNKRRIEYQSAGWTGFDPEAPDKTWHQFAPVQSKVMPRWGIDFCALTSYIWAERSNDTRCVTSASMRS